MGQNRRRVDRRTADDKIRYIRMAAIPLIVVIILVIIIVVMDRKPKDQEAQASSEGISTQMEGEGGSSEGQEAAGDGTGESIEPDNNRYTTDFSQYELQKDAVPQVNQLISDYFQAKIDQDAERLFAIFGKGTDDAGLENRRAELQNEAVFIDDYQEIVCYTKPGLTDDSYVVYVTYNVKFKRVDTLAPGLMWCYALKDESGNYMIREHVIGEEADYVAKQNQTEDVRLLSNQVNERLRQAIESDTLLAGIYKELRDGAVVSSSQGDDEEGEDSQISLEEGGAPQPEAGVESQTESAGENTADEAGTGGSDPAQGLESQGGSEIPSGSGEDSRITIE